MNNESKNLLAALVKAQAEFTPVAKDRENPYFKSEYATLLAVTQMVRPILAKYGIGYTQTFADAGKSIVTKLFHASGEEMSLSCPFSCDSAKPQDYGSAITYFRRYALQAALGIVVCDATEDDGNAANGNSKPAAPAKPVEAKKAAPDFRVCPCGKVKGQRWEAIPTETLKAIMATDPKKVPILTNDHRNAIVAEFRRRETAGQIKNI